MDAPCGGRGTCGKCRIRLVKGDLAVTEADRSHFSEEELKNGMRLACRAHPAGDCVIRLKEARENAFYIPGSPEKAGEESLELKSAGKAGRKGVAVDIGTTTVAMELADLETGERPRIYTSLNTQRQYGADVISRIQAADEGKAKEMQTCIRDVLREGLARLTDGGKEHIDRMVIGANTTMVHLLMGYPCHSLGVYPFTPCSTERIDTDGQALLGEAAEDFDVSVFPGGVGLHRRRYHCRPLCPGFPQKRGSQCSCGPGNQRRDGGGEQGPDPGQPPQPRALPLREVISSAAPEAYRGLSPVPGGTDSRWSFRPSAAEHLWGSAAPVSSRLCTR